MLRKTVLDPMIPEEEFAAASPLRRRPLITVAVIVILLAAGIFLGAKFSGMPSENSPYSAVYLTTGDVYFGKLAWFPKPHLKDPLYLERGSEQIAIRRFSGVFWGPGEKLYINPREIVFSARIRASSPLVVVLDDPSVLEQSPGPAATSAAE